MRAIFLILIIAVVGLIAAIATGYIDISQTRPARAPTLQAEDGAIRASGAQAPAFEVQTGSVQVGAQEANVAVPKVQVQRDQKRMTVPVVEVRGPKDDEQNTAH